METAARVCTTDRLSARCERSPLLRLSWRPACSEGGQPHFSSFAGLFRECRRLFAHHPELIRMRRRHSHWHLDYALSPDGAHDQSVPEPGTYHWRRRKVSEGASACGFEPSSPHPPQPIATLPLLPFSSHPLPSSSQRPLAVICSCAPCHLTYRLRLPLASKAGDDNDGRRAARALR
jgi:hypothetical protein